MTERACRFEYVMGIGYLCKVHPGEETYYYFHKPSICDIGLAALRSEIDRLRKLPLYGDREISDLKVNLKVWERTGKNKLAECATLRATCEQQATALISHRSAVKDLADQRDELLDACLEKNISIEALRATCEEQARTIARVTTILAEPHEFVEPNYKWAMKVIADARQALSPTPKEG